MVLLGHPSVMIMRYNFKLFAKLPYFKNYYEEIVENSRALYGFYRKHIQEYKKKIDFTSDAEPADVCEAYLRELKKMEKYEGEHYFTEDQLVGVLADLWVAGQETTTVALAASIIYMMLYPEIQSKFQEELDQVIGSDRFVTMDDKPKLHYELNRIATNVSQNVFHRTTKEVAIKGYTFPKDTIIVPQLSVVLRDEK
uniref:Cytochrome P450 n=1 Tax=Acrobeloides nanus TaxID=290746 RepID=A0A914CLJ0_9BILA